MARHDGSCLRQSVFREALACYFTMLNDADRLETRSRHALDLLAAMPSKDRPLTTEVGEELGRFDLTGTIGAPTVRMQGEQPWARHERGVDRQGFIDQPSRRAMIILDDRTAASARPMANVEAEHVVAMVTSSCTCYHPAIPGSTSSATWRDVPCAPVMVGAQWPTRWRNAWWSRW